MRLDIWRKNQEPKWSKVFLGQRLGVQGTNQNKWKFVDALEKGMIEPSYRMTEKVKYVTNNLVLGQDLLDVRNEYLDARDAS